MPMTESQKESIAKYRREQRDRLSTDIPKGKRDFYNAAAKSLNLSLAKLVQFGVESYIQNHAGEDFKPAPVVDTQDKFTAAEKKLVEEFGRLPVDTQKALIKLIQSINQNNAKNQPE